MTVLALKSQSDCHPIQSAKWLKVTLHEQVVVNKCSCQLPLLGSELKSDTVKFFYDFGK